MAAESETVIQGHDRAAIVQALRRRIAQAEQAFDGSARRGSISTGLAALDARLAGGGLPAGGLVELLSGEGDGGGGGGDSGSDGGGTLTLATWLAGAQASTPASNAGYVVVIDRSGEFYPPAAVGLGVAMAKMVLVQPGREADGLWAAQEALRSPAVAAVLMTGLRRVDHRQSRLLQLAAEAGGGIGLIVRPARATGRVSSAAVRLMVSPTACEPGQYRWCVQVMRCRGGPASPPVVIGLDDETRVVPVDAASVDRAREPATHRIGG